MDRITAPAGVRSECVTADRPTSRTCSWRTGPTTTPVASAPVAANSAPSFTATLVLETAPAATVTSGTVALGAGASHLATGQGVIAVTAPRRVVRAR
jgi:hypothetical protein